MQRRHALTTLAALSTGAAAPLSALAQSAPVAGPAPGAAKPLRIIVPYAAGGPIDVTVRALAERVRDTLGTVVVENRPGGGGNIGVDAIAKADPDGFTIGVGAVATHAINPWLFRSIPFNALTDFTPITQMVRVPNLLVMNTETADRLGIKTLADFMVYARKNPGRLNYGSGGNGSAGHLAGEMFKQAAKVFAVHIPYNGGAPAQLALVSGQVDYNFDNLATAAPNIRSGRLRALAVTTPQRSPLLPDAPPMADVLPGFAVDTWWGLVGPARIPAPVLARLNTAFVAALNAPETKSRFATLMAEPVPTTPEQFAALIRAEHTRYEAVVKASGAKVD